MRTRCVQETGLESKPLFLVRKSEALKMVADVAVSHAERVLAEF